MARGFIAFSTTCDVGGGTGSVIDHPCHTCGGKGMTEEKSTIKVDIPRGVETGETYAVRGQGEDGPPNGTRGELYVVFEVEPHELFVREGEHLYVEWPISFPQAALGATIEVPTLGGAAELKMPAGTQTHHVFKIRGKGMQTSSGRAGDLFVRVIVRIPEKLTPEQKKPTEQLAQSLQTTEKPTSRPRHGDEEKGFFEKFRDAIRDTLKGYGRVKASVCIRDAGSFLHGRHMIFVMTS